MSSLKSKPPPLAYAIVLFLGAALSPFLMSLDHARVGPFAASRSLSSGALYSLKSAHEYTNLQDAQDIDTDIETLAMAQTADPEHDDKCSRVFLYLPDVFAGHGHGSQINTYLIGVTMATYLDRAMLLVEAPLGQETQKTKYAGGSQFGCPIDAFKETYASYPNPKPLRSKPKWEVREEFPRGFSRLVEQPTWLDHGCAMPCPEKTYAEWRALSNDPTNEITCTNPDGTTTNVVAASGGQLRGYFRKMQTTMTFNHPSSEARAWATNLGATNQEAALFSQIRSPTQIWDYVLGLLNKAGFLKFQPWIARDVELFLKSFDIPLEEEYSAIHVRRGDKLEFEARSSIVGYWRTQGHTDANNLPSDYIPFAAYLAKWDGEESCSKDADGAVNEVMKHNVYIATDDPVVVRQEIADLPVVHINENTILWNGCHQLTFFFNPTDDSAFALNGDGEKGFKNGNDGDSCFMRYHRNIASIADMMILAKAKTFIGEYNSNWGRVIRLVRVRLNKLEVPVVLSDSKVDQDAISVVGPAATSVLDLRVAWGSTRAPTPGI